MARPVDPATGQAPSVARHRAEPSLQRRSTRAVEQLALIGSPREDRFDRLTRLARKIFGVEIANVTLLDRDRDRFWLKASTLDGLESYPAIGSFCQTTVTTQRELVVEDAQTDPEFSHLPWVHQDPYLRFYAGVPVLDGNRIVIGTFCLADRRPRAFGPAQVEILRELAGWVRHELLTSNDVLRARQVQQSMLPDGAPKLAGYDVAGVCIPSLSVGGDFFDWGPLPGGMGFTLSDVMGKGTGAAILSATVRAAIRGAAARYRRRGEARPRAVEIVSDAAASLQPDLDRTQTIVTAFFGYLHQPRHELHWADAGHGLAVIVDRAGTPTWLTGQDLPLGVLDASHSDSESLWTEHITPLSPGDRLVVFSDGLPDLLGGDRYATDAILEMIAESRTPGELIAEITRLTGAHIPVDDVTALVVQRRDT